jgi:uncharacterized protein YkwD
MIKRYILGVIFLILITCIAPENPLFISPPLLSYTYSTDETNFIDSINTYRIEIGIQPLKEYSTLSVLAYNHNQYMISSGDIGHTEFPNRLKYIRDTLGFTGMGENVGYGYSGVPSFINAFKKSESHNSILINPKYEKHGISISSDSLGDLYLTHILIY